MQLIEDMFAPILMELNRLVTIGIESRILTEHVLVCAAVIYAASAVMSEAKLILL